MNLMSIHSILTKKKFYYFDGCTNNMEDVLYISFSTGLNLRGDVVHLVLGDDNHRISYSKQSIVGQKEIKEIIKEDINDNELMLFLKNIK